MAGLAACNEQCHKCGEHPARSFIGCGDLLSPSCRPSCPAELAICCDSSQEDVPGVFVRQPARACGASCASRRLRSTATPAARYAISASVSAASAETVCSPPTRTLWTGASTIASGASIRRMPWRGARRVRRAQSDEARLAAVATASWPSRRSSESAGQRQRQTHYSRRARQSLVVVHSRETWNCVTCTEIQLRRGRYIRQRSPQTNHLGQGCVGTRMM